MHFKTMKTIYTNSYLNNRRYRVHLPKNVNELFLSYRIHVQLINFLVSSKIKLALLKCVPGGHRYALYLFRNCIFNNCGITCM